MTVIWVCFVRLPDVPVMVTVAVPIAAVADAVSVSAVETGSGFELKEAVTPFGRPEAEKVTLAVKPFWGVTLMMLPPLVPCVIVRLAGEADSVKLGFGAAAGQLFTRLAALTVPMPVAKSQPVAVP